MSIEVILFDVGGVIFTPLHDEAVKERRLKLARQLGFSTVDQMWRQFYTGSEWNLAKTGRITEDEMWQILLTPHGLKSKQSQAEFVAELYKDCGLRDEMRGLIGDLRYRYRLAILSNATNRLTSLLTDQLSIAHCFELVVNSSEVGLAKPGKAVYLRTLALLQVLPEQILFIDNQARNTEAAEKLGINSLVFRNVKQLKADLLKLDVLKT